MELRTAMSRLDRERPALALLVLAFLLLTGWMLAQPHDLVAAGHLKDEEGYYPWAELYLDGYWSLPLQLANGDHRDEEAISIDSGVPPLQVAWEIVALDPDGLDDDLRVSVAFNDGAPAVNASVSIPRPQGALTAVTDADGGAELRGLPAGNPPLEVRASRDGQSVVYRTLLEVPLGNAVRYGIASLASIEFLTDRTLGGLLEVQLEGDREGLTVRFNGQPRGETDAQGRLALGDLGAKRGTLRVERDGDPVAGARLLLDGHELGATDAQGRRTAMVVEQVRLTVALQDTLGVPVAGAEVELSQRGPDATPEPLGMTGADGKLVAERELELGEYQLASHWLIEGYDPPLASGIAEVDGEYHYVNHWPPGPSAALMPLILLGAEPLFGTLLALIAGAATYGLARRWCGWRVAWLATAFTLANATVLLLWFSQWMGDLAAVSFALPGLWLVVEAAHRGRREGASRSVLLLALGGGVLFGLGVSMRYTTVVMAGAPYLYIGWLNLPAGRTRELPRRLREALAWPAVRDPLLQAGALTVGLLLVGIPLAAYNAHYFGGALNSGYQSRNQLEVSSDGDNLTVETHEASVSMWDGYINLGEQERENLPQVAKFVAAFFPALLCAFPGALALRRQPAAGIALGWWLGSISAIYLTQGWVLANTFTDIRYYLPLAPPAGILAAAGLAQISGSLERGKWLALAIAALIIASGAVAFADAETDLQQRWNRSGQQQQPTTEATIFQLDATPQQFLDRRVHVGGAEVVELRGSSAALLRDPVEGNATVMLVFGQHAVTLEPGERIAVSAQFRADNHPENDFALFLQSAADLEHLQGPDGEQPVANQHQPPQGQGQPRGKLPLNEAQRLALTLGLAAAALANGSAAWVAWRRGFL
ncbi:MAG: carboxypeptidase regulatory-like domain-containing protein [Candidatus Poseidoniia archaeon]|nr:carboxypeptidase regulatory-like domain-containing protein [Candidatus Poseidoniia archaeon]MDP7006821.1 carboxypeptidase regulatory-like domain-containing protein [Candidatus Poseidoniia archaeon]